MIPEMCHNLNNFRDINYYDTCLGSCLPLWYCLKLNSDDYHITILLVE